MHRAPIFLSLAAALALAAGCAASPSPGPTSAGADQAHTAAAASPASGASAADPFPVLASPAEQARMQKYADDLYDRRYVRSTLHVEGGDFDCVDFDKQPGCKNGGCSPAPAVPPPPPPPPGGQAPAATATPGGGGAACPSGTIPVRRPDIRIMRRFHTLEEYLQGGKVAPPH